MLNCVHIYLLDDKMKLITSVFFSLICFGIIIDSSLALTYCEIERSICETKKSHVACNHNSVESVSVKIY